METWMDFNLSTEWGLDLMVQPNGPFGDQNDACRLYGDTDPVYKPRDVVEQSITPSPDSLDLDWMESGDLGSLLDSLGYSQSGLSMLGDTMLDCSQELALKNNINLAKSFSEEIAPFLSSDEMEGFIQGLTPPDSPEQMTPVIKIEKTDLLRSEIFIPLPQNVVISSVDLNVDSGKGGVSAEPLQSPNFLFREGDKHDLEPGTFSPPNTFVDPDPKIDHSYSESGDSILDSPSSSSDSSQEDPKKPSIASIIKSSPELFKVIATSPDSSARFLPYQRTPGKSKKDQEASKPRSGRPTKAAVSSILVSKEFLSSAEDKKERKKIQNKNAAIRYRQKKRLEVNEIVGEVQTLESKNINLKTKVEDLQREIKYMKNLMEDIYRAKGVVN